VLDQEQHGSLKLRLWFLNFCDFIFVDSLTLSRVFLENAASESGHGQGRDCKTCGHQPKGKLKLDERECSI
jgi:hypothetical protein